VTDSAALMGMGAVNVGERLLASLGKAGPVAPVFEAAADVPDAGVLLAVPALLACGLLRDAQKFFALPRGYYGLESIFVLLALLALARVKSVEQLRYCAPGEWGKLLGLDRVPEVRTLRTKLALLTATDAPAQWSAQLCAEWMQDDPESAGIFYVDGHVRVYNGDQTALPRHYVSRQRLCLRATTDYWVNALDGQPFFVVTKEVDPGLLKTLEDDILPRLEKDAPALVSAEELLTDRLRHRFVLVFDREGYSPQFWLRMHQRRIACLTYHKHPGPNWPEQEFTVHSVKVAGGETIEMQLAERGTNLGPLWTREIRRLGRGGHQTSILATDYMSELIPIAVAMFARWGQENFFRYMREHYGLDRLISYDTEPIPDTVRVVNPTRRELEGKIRARTGWLSRRRAEFGGLILQEPIEPARVERWGNKKAALQEEIAGLEKALGELKERRKDIPSHLSFKDLPEDQRFERLAVQSKHFIDTIKMIAYRAESAMVHVLRDHMAKHDDARSLLRGLYRTEADLLPDYQAGTLRVCLHHQANRATDVALAHLCEQLNETETVFPATNLRLVYELVSPPAAAQPADEPPVDETSTGNDSACAPASPPTSAETLDPATPPTEGPQTQPKQGLLPFSGSRRNPGDPKV
jgi:hypothetical protein